MKKINKIQEFVELYDLYRNMLTESQQEAFEAYYFEDLTLQEIADRKNISKNAIHDSISKTESTLRDLEDKIGFLKYVKENVTK